MYNVGGLYYNRTISKKESQMSVNRENAIWKSPATGEWKMGLYSFEYTNEGSEDFDYEWDVEYNYSRFSRVITGGKSADDCIEKYCRTEANAGSYNIYEDKPENEKNVQRFEAMHSDLKARIEASRQRHASSQRW